MTIVLQPNESLVLEDENWAQLRYCNVIPGSIRISFKNKETSQVTWYEEMHDYEVVYDKGYIRRTHNSSIPDGKMNVFYGMDKFDHTEVETYGNYDFTLFAEYSFNSENNLTIDELVTQQMIKNKTQKLINTIEKLKAGKEVKYLVFGDSISTGAEASSHESAYFGIFTEELRKINPKANVTTTVKAIGGEDTSGAISRFEADILPLKPDLVTIAYGMNDQNKRLEGGHFVEPEMYEENIDKMVSKLLSEGIEVVLITPCLPNPCWIYTSGDSQLYVQALLRLGRKYSIPVADVQGIWIKELEFKKSHAAMLFNNINHPNDYGHYIYAKVLMGLL